MISESQDKPTPVPRSTISSLHPRRPRRSQQRATFGGATGRVVDVLALLMPFLFVGGLLCPTVVAAQASDDGSTAKASTAEASPAQTSTAAAEETPGEEATEAERPQNTLRWATASEVENFGYDVYRAESADGPFERVTEEPITGGGTTDEVSNYFFVDLDIDPTRDYYYYVESIDLSGSREKFTPIQKAAAKEPSPEQEESGGDEDKASGSGDEAPSGGGEEGAPHGDG